MAKDTSKTAYDEYRKRLFDVSGKSKAQTEREKPRDEDGKR